MFRRIVLIINIKEGNIIITKVAQYYSCCLCKKIDKEEDEEVIAYAIEIFLGAFLKISTILLLGFSLGIICEVIVGLVAFSLFRVVSGGFHFRNFLRCYLISVSLITIISYLSKYYLTNQVIFNLWLSQPILFLITTLFLLIFKPLINKNRPNHKEQNKFLVLSIIVVFFELSFSLYLQNTNPSLSITINLSVLAQALTLIRREK